MSERYLITRYLTENANMFRELSDEAVESISEVHFADKIGAQGTFGISLEPDFAEYVSKADNLLPVNGLMRIPDYGLGASLEDDGALPPLEDYVSGAAPEYPTEELGNSKNMLKQYVRGPVIDQGSEGACVGFSATNFLRGGPKLSHRYKSTAELNQIARAYYQEFQRNDEWPGTDYSGTSVSAACKVLARDGLIEGGAMTHDLAVQDKFLVNESSLMLASDWFEGMYRTDANGFIRPTGRKVGGHAYWQFGLSKWLTKYIFNSWSKSFGFNGVGYISRADQEWLRDHGNLRGYAAIQIKR